MRATRSLEDYLPVIDVVIQRVTESGEYVFTGKNSKQFLKFLLAASRTQDHAQFQAWLLSDEIVATMKIDLAKLPNAPPQDFFTPMFQPRLPSVIWPRLKRLTLPRATAKQWGGTLANMARDGVTVPYIRLFEAQGLKTFPIKRVIVGPHPNKIERKRAVEILLSNNGISADVIASDTSYRGK